MKNCAVESNFGDDRYDHVTLIGQYADVGGNFRLADILTGALPGWYGTGVGQPTGHDGYFVFGPGDRYVKILALAAQGIAAIERSLAKHAAFEEYLRARTDLQSADGDRRPDA